MPAQLVLSGKVWQKIIVVTTLALPLLLTFVVPAQAVIKIEDIEPDNIFVATPELTFLVGNDEENLMLGSIAGDTIFAKGDDDIINGGFGDDEISAGSGEDLVSGGGGFDFIKGERGDDVLLGGLEDDILEGDDGNDSIFGDIGNDVLEGDAGADAFDCGAGIDTITDFNPGQGDTKSPNCEIFGENVPPNIVR